MEKLTTQKVSLIIAIVFSAVLFFLGGGFDSKAPLTYAQISFDGGYQNIGVISSRRISTDVAIWGSGSGSKKVYSGSVSSVVTDLKKDIADPENANDQWNNGVLIDARAFIEWKASESDFELTTESVFEIASSENVISLKKTIKLLESMESEAKLRADEVEKRSISYISSPGGTVTFAQVVSKLINNWRR